MVDHEATDLFWMPEVLWERLLLSGYRNYQELTAGPNLQKRRPPESLTFGAGQKQQGNTVRAILVEKSPSIVTMGGPDSRYR